MLVRATMGKPCSVEELDAWPALCDRSVFVVALPGLFFFFPFFIFLSRVRTQNAWDVLTEIAKLLQPQYCIISMNSMQSIFVPIQAMIMDPDCHKHWPGREERRNDSVLGAFDSSLKSSYQNCW